MLAAIEKHTPRDRNIVLVGHGMTEDGKVPSSLGSKLRNSAITSLDTYVIARNLGLKNLTLLELLQQLGCPRGKFHNAGNDANLSLRAVLLLAIKDFESEDLEIAEQVEALRAVAMAPLPRIIQPKVRRHTKTQLLNNRLLRIQEEV